MLNFYFLSFPQTSESMLVSSAIALNNLLVEILPFFITRGSQYYIKEVNVYSCLYAFDADKQGVVQPLHQVF